MLTKLDERQKTSIRSLLQIAGKDMDGVLVHLFDLQERYDRLKEVADEMLPKIDTMLANLETLRPVKGKDYATDEEQKTTADAILARIPVPKDADEAMIIKKVVALVSKKIKVPKNGIDGKDAVVDYDHIIAEVSALLTDMIPEPQKIEIPEYTPETGETILEKLLAVDMDLVKARKLYLNPYFEQSQETFRTQQQIDNAVSTLRSQVSFLINKVENLGNASGAGGSLIGETPTGTIDGVNTDFVVTNTPVQFFWNGQYQNPNAGDYTFDSGTMTITMATPPSPGDNLVSFYQ